MLFFNLGLNLMGYVYGFGSNNNENFKTVSSLERVNFRFQEKRRNL